MLSAFACILALSNQTSVPLKTYKLPFGYSVKLPAAPLERKQADITAYTSIQGKNVFVIGYEDVASKPNYKSPGETLAASVMGTRDGFHGNLTEYADTMLDGWPGIEYKIDNELFTTWVRTFIVDGKMIQIQADYAHGATPAYAQVVLDSLTVPAGTKAGPLTKAGVPFAPFIVPNVPFYVDLPGQPKTFDIPVASGQKNLLLHCFGAEQDLRTFLFGYSDSMGDAAKTGKPEDFRKIRETVIKKAIESLNPTTIGALKNVSIGGNEWTRCTFTFEDMASGRMQAVIIDGRIYLLLSTAPNPWVQTPNFEQFFNSFHPVN